MYHTFWFADLKGQLYAAPFESRTKAEDFAEDKGYHFFGVITSQEAIKKLKEYGSTKYTFYNCPHLYCMDCKYFSIKADREESLCKRVDHKTVKFFKSPVSSYSCGKNNIPCKDFELKFPDRVDFKDKWAGIEDIWPVYVDAWLGGRPPLYETFHLGNDFSTDYLVPFDLFYNGGMIEDGILKAVFKRTSVRDKREYGIQLYKMKYEEIAGVVISTGEVIKKGSA